MDLELQRKRALITGATRGIGRAIAMRLAAEGCAIALCARDGDDVLKEVAEELREAGSPAVFSAPIDVTDTSALERFVQGAAEGLGGLDLVVASAGGALGGARLQETDAEQWRATFDLNVVHPATLLRAATPSLRTAGGGSAVLIASVSGFKPQPRSQYAAAKAAEIHLAASLARELGPDGIRVNAVSPGSILFDGGSWQRRRDDDPDGFARWVAQEFPHGRLGTPEEVADVVAFLLSPRAAWVSGANVVVDGAQNQPGIAGY